MIARGVSRTVLLIGPWAIKAPSLRNGQRYFVKGMYGNILEADHWRKSRHPNLAPVYAVGPFGLWLVMRRYRTLVRRRLTNEEIAALPFIGLDNNGANVAWDNGRFVVIDYGESDWMLDLSRGKR